MASSAASEPAPAVRGGWLMTSPTPDTIVAVIADILTRRGAESYLGEAVSMQQHMLQAATLAEREGAADALVAAALLHDIGHYTGDWDKGPGRQLRPESSGGQCPVVARSIFRE